jgi:hypothetical protein
MRWARRTQVKIGLTVATPLVVSRLCVRDIDRMRDTVDMTAYDLAVAHQFDLRQIPNPDRSQVRLLSKYPSTQNELAFPLSAGLLRGDALQPCAGRACSCRDGARERAPRSNDHD